MDEGAAPASILVVGAGVFGLSTVLALLKERKLKEKDEATGGGGSSTITITIVDAAASIPNADGSSVDTSRIVRADYSNAIYTKLAEEAQVLWRDQTDSGYGGQGRYAEPGFLLTVDGDDKGVNGEYVKGCYHNVYDEKVYEAQARPRVELLEGEAEIRRASGYERVKAGWGYVNWRSGWADAAKTVDYMRRRVEELGAGRVTFRLGQKVERVMTEDGDDNKPATAGVQLANGEKLSADLVILATGAWSGGLIDLRGRAVATGQVLTYIQITEEEEEAMKNRPTIMNMSRGMFIIPPRDRLLKIARHGFGYRNPTLVPAKNILGLEGGDDDESKKSKNDEFVEVSLPLNNMQAPREGRNVCRAALREMLPPQIAERPFVKTRVCWYSDTPTGDFIIDWLPGYQGRVFVATGGSGHGFKFAPIIGDRILDAILGRLDPKLRHSWRWREVVSKEELDGCDDGSRAGPRGMIAKEEMAKESSL